MTHTVCGHPIEFREVDRGEGLHEFVARCTLCGTDPPDHELSAGRPWELVDEETP